MPDDVKGLDYMGIGVEQSVSAFTTNAENCCESNKGMQNTLIIKAESELTSPFGLRYCKKSVNFDVQSITT